MNFSGAKRPPTNPVTPAPSTISGNGRPSAKMATKAAAAMPHNQPFLSTREPMRTAADTTMAVTAGLMPYSAPATAGTCPRTWQHHAVIQGMQETALRNPALSLDQVLVHERDLPGRPPEAEKAQAKPVEESLPEGGGRRGDVKRMFVHGKG